MNGEFLLPVGLKVDGVPVKKLPIAETGGEAEKIYKTSGSSSTLYSWFGQVIAVSVKSINGTAIAKPFITKLDETEDVPALVQEISLFDVGALLLQIQTECWQEVIKDQEILCKYCGKSLTTDISLKEMPIPFDESKDIPEEMVLALPDTYIISTGLEVLAEYEGQKYNRLTFRIPLLKDAIRHQAVGDDEVLFWRKLAFDCITGMYYEEEGEKTFVSEGYLNKRGMLLFTKDWSAKTLKSIRDFLQTGLPTAKFYYTGKCPCPRKRIIPYFTEVSNFFS